MKYLPIFLVFFGVNAYSFECADGYKRSSSMPTHIEHATEIFYGLPISAECITDECRDIELKVEVLENLKGDAGTSIIINNYFPTQNKIRVGQGFVIFLYGSNNLGPCGLVLEAGYPGAWENHYQYLVDNTDRIDIDSAPYLRELLSLLGWLP